MGQLERVKTDLVQLNYFRFPSCDKIEMIFKLKDFFSCQLDFHFFNSFLNFFIAEG